MFQRLILAVQQNASADTKRSGVATTLRVGSFFLVALRHLMMVAGGAAIVVLGMMFIKPELADKFKDLSPFATPEDLAEEDAAPQPPSLAMLMHAPGQSGSANGVKTVGFSEEDAKLLGNQRQQQWVTNWLSKRYRIANDAANLLVSAAYLTAKEIKLDPLLILSVMAIESGLNPFAESPVGAQGLMQVMSKVHQEKFEELGGVKAALNPVANIKVGALILKDYVAKAGSVEAGLKMYVGAGAADSDSGYGNRVLTEYKRLKEVSAGKNVPTVFTAPAPAAPVQATRPADQPQTVKQEPVEAKAKSEHKEQVAAL